jgi:hypothetical protein
MLETFGARMRRRREEHGIALLTIANQTKIKVSLLEALERDDITYWPSGIFRRSFIRSYAQAIGLDADATVREFLALYPDPAGVSDPAAEEQPADGVALGGPPTRLRSLLGAALESLSRRRNNHTVVSLVDRPIAPPLPVARRAEEVQVAASAQEIAAPQRPESVSTDSDLIAVAHVCTEFGRVTTTDQVKALLPKAARILDASGLIVWVWDDQSAELKPAFVHGYSENVLAQLPGVSPDADNATAAAFRSRQPCAITGGEHATGALVVPLLTAAGCAGVLALEVQHGGEQATLVRVAATIFAALLAQLFSGNTAEDTQFLPIARSSV